MARLNRYPTRAAVDAALDDDLVRWIRFLRSPADDEELVLVNLIIEKYNGRKQEDPDAMIAASKRVGW